MEFDLKKELIKVLAGIGYAIVIYLIIRFFNLGVVGAYFVVLLSMVVLSLYTKTFKIKRTLLSSVTLAIFFILIYYLAGYGFFISTAFICAYILYNRRKRFIEVKQHIEGMLWGKPLKEFIKNKEKPPKIKLAVTKKVKD